MKLPRLTRRLILEQQTRTPDGAGGFSDQWAPVAVHHAELTAQSGGETVIGDRQAGRQNVRAIIRYVPFGATARPRPDQRFREGSRMFDIRSVTEADSRNHWLACDLTERAPQ